jgi:hypothetical protein
MIAFLIAILGPNWKPRLLGYIVGLPATLLALPPLFEKNNIPLPPKVAAIMGVLGGIGFILMGHAVKANTTHSSLAEVKQSTIEKGEAVPVALKTPVEQLLTPPPAVGSSISTKL